MKSKIWLAVDKDGVEVVFDKLPTRSTETDSWDCGVRDAQAIDLPKGTILTLTKTSLTWENEPYMIEFEV
jgi:hypothetical protein